MALTMKFNTASVITLLISGSSVDASLPVANLNLLAAAILLVKVSQAIGDQASGTFPFVHIDQGRCRDSNNKNYPHVYTPTTATYEDPQPCIDFCMQANPEKVAGLTIIEYATYVRCQCDLTDIVGVETSQYDSAEWVVLFNNDYTTGTGNVEGVGGTGQFSSDCFANQVSYRTMFVSSCFVIYLLQEKSCYSSLYRISLHRQCPPHR